MFNNIIMVVILIKRVSGMGYFLMLGIIWEMKWKNGSLKNLVMIVKIFNGSMFKSMKFLVLWGWLILCCLGVKNISMMSLKL